MKTKPLVKVIAALCFFVLLSIFNLIWKFSASVSFNDMNTDRQINVAASVIFIVIGIPIIIRMIVMFRK